MGSPLHRAGRKKVTIDRHAELQLTFISYRRVGVLRFSEPTSGFV